MGLARELPTLEIDDYYVERPVEFRCSACNRLLFKSVAAFGAHDIAARCQECAGNGICAEYGQLCGVKCLKKKVPDIRIKCPKCKKVVTIKLFG
jgi:hypothetical protein